MNREKVSADFMALVEKEKIGEITGDDIREALNRKYTGIDNICGQSVVE